MIGFIAGPVTDLVDPDELFGDLLIPVVSASVAVILFEGGLSLSLRELRGTGSVLWRLVTIGALATWAAGAAAAHYLVGLDVGLSLLVGAILIVTGPTVIGPLLRNVRPTAGVGATLRWEGILIDPIGAVLAVLVFEAIILGDRRGDAVPQIVEGVLSTAGVGIAVGVGGAIALVIVIKRYLIPDFLHNAFSLAIVLGAFTLADRWVAESGLVAVTVMGIALANQRFVPVRHIIEFKETLRVLLISGLFIILAAELDLDAIRSLGFNGVLFLGVLLVARPFAVLLSTIGSKMAGRERAFLAAVAPRGIVAAAISSVFALELAEQGHAQAELLAPLTFVAIVGTIAIYGSTAGRVARLLGVSDRQPQGVLIVGANPLARALAGALHDEELRVVMVDTDWGNVAAARLKGLPAQYRSILSEEVNHQTDLSGIGRLFALTSNDELNALAVQHTVHLFGRASVYQLAPREGGSPRTAPLSPHQRGRILFSSGATYSALSDRFERGAQIKKTPLSEEFDFGSFKDRYGDGALPLFVITKDGKLSVFVVDGKPTPKAGDKLISLVDADAGDGAVATAVTEGSAVDV